MRPPGWVLGTIVGAVIMSVPMVVGWSSVSTVIKRLNPEDRASLITLCGTAVGAIFLSLIVGEKQIRDEWEPAVGGVLGCLFALFITLIAALL